MFRLFQISKKRVLGAPYFFKSQSGLSIVELLVGIAISAFLFLVLSQVTVDFEKVRVSDSRAADLTTLTQLVGLSLNPFGPTNSTGQNSCDLALGGIEVIKNASGVLSVNPAAPANLITLRLGSGGDGFLTQPGGPSGIPQNFGQHWRVVSIQFEPKDCIAMDPAGTTTCLVGGPPPSFETEIAGDVVVRVEGRDPNKNGQIEQRNIVTPVKVRAPPAVPSLPNYVYIVAGCRSATPAPSGPSAPLDNQALCRALCFAGNPATASTSNGCWNGTSCDLSMQVCDAMGLPNSGTGCQPNQLLTNYLRGADGLCPSGQVSRGFEIITASSDPQFVCSLSTGVLPAPVSCTNCAVRASLTATNARNIAPGDPLASLGTTYQEGAFATECRNQKNTSAWVNYQGSGTSLSCGAPLDNLRFCTSPRSRCSN